ncbi:hypothetical protein D5S18_23720 [Nocardia panacis]|uniref:Anti-sigma-K factor RskA N-terminal domain-containing protein n=1 Tax=Nocardia panacis TaxID=2340916 RepID=A0A3A4KAT4_9NOCA|nr:hypothetical protein [Nocardia panacis]RJO72178.1 hypothetical protein D5S18_23720 [Nocardia panacis]
MHDDRIDLAHTVALGSIDDEDQHAIAELSDTEDPALRTEFVAAVRSTEDALAALAETTALAPPSALRARLLATIAAEQPPVAS